MRITLNQSTKSENEDVFSQQKHSFDSEDDHSNMSQINTLPCTPDIQVNHMLRHLPLISIQSKPIKKEKVFFQKISDSNTTRGVLSLKQNSHKTYSNSNSNASNLQCRKVVSMKMSKVESLRDLNATYGGQFNMQTSRKYLKGSSMYTDLSKTLKRCELVQRKLAPQDHEFIQAKFPSFVEQLDRGNFTQNSNSVMLNQQNGFFDRCTLVNNKELSNPVINKIQNFMSKKEKRNSLAGRNNQNKQPIDQANNASRISFLSIRNLWTNPQAQSLILGRERPENVNQQAPQMQNEQNIDNRISNYPVSLLSTSHSGNDATFERQIQDIIVPSSNQQNAQEIQSINGARPTERQNINGFSQLQQHPQLQGEIQQQASTGNASELSSSFTHSATSNTTILLNQSFISANQLQIQQQNLIRGEISNVCQNQSGQNLNQTDLNMSGIPTNSLFYPDAAQNSGVFSPLSGPHV
eukprot:403336179